MSIGMVLLLLGAIMLFIAAFGGGFEFKGFTISKINRTSRILGFLVGGVFMSIGTITENLDTKIDLLDVTVAEKKAGEEKAGGNNDINTVDNTEPSVISADLVNKLEEYDAAWTEAIIDNRLLLDKYTELNQHPGFNSLTITQIDQVNSRIADLKESIDQWKQLETLETQNKTVAEKIAAWRRYKDIPHLENENIEIAQQKIETLENSLNRYASIKSQNNFLICNKVVNRKCRVEKTQFNLGPNKLAKVWVWAKVNAPQKEKIKLKISKSGSQNMVTDLSLNVKKSSGYRTYKINNIQEPGNYEAKLYNSKEQLIGFRTFEVN